MKDIENVVNLQPDEWPENPGEEALIGRVRPSLRQDLLRLLGAEHVALRAIAATTVILSISCAEMVIHTLLANAI